AQLEQGFHEQPGINRTRARFDHKPDVTSRFVAHIGNERQLLLVDEFGEPFYQPAFLHQPGDLSDDDEVSAATGLFLVPARPDPKRPAPGGIGLSDSGGRINDDTSGRKIGTGHVFQQRAASGIGCIDQVKGRVAELRRIVGWDRCRHPNRDALRAIGKKIWERARQTTGSFSEPSYVGLKSIASSSMPSSKRCATSVSRASV